MEITLLARTLILTAFYAHVLACANPDYKGVVSAPDAGETPLMQGDAMVVERGLVHFQLERGEQRLFRIDVPSGAHFLGASVIDNSITTIYLAKGVIPTREANDANGRHIELAFTGAAGGAAPYTGGAEGSWFIVVESATADEALGVDMKVEYMTDDDFSSTPRLEVDIPVHHLGVASFRLAPIDHPPLTFEVPVGKTARLRVSESFGFADVKIFRDGAVEPMDSMFAGPSGGESVALWTPGIYTIVPATSCLNTCYSFWGMSLSAKLE
jgi:hypothetical protein